MRRVYGERPEYIEDMFLPSEDNEAEAMKKGRWGKWSESASTSPEHRREREEREVSEDGESVEGAALGEPQPAFLSYLKLKVRGLFHAPQSTLNKASCIIEEGLLSSTVKRSWSLLLDPDSDVSGAASASLVVASVKAPRHTMNQVMGELGHAAPHVRINACLRLQVLWRNRYDYGFCTNLRERGNMLHFN